MKISQILLLITITFLALGCRRENVRALDSPHANENAIYYWKTTLEIDSESQKFLKENNVERAYVRFFDVVENKSLLSSDPIIPNATIVFKDTLPVKDIVPTVYITQEAMKRINGHEWQWAERIVERVDNMFSYNELGVLNEIQLDCDWTEATRDSFFNLCKYVKSILNSIPDSNRLVSSTIRLHQLTQPAPPVDYGVLMLYNTGSFKNPAEKNSILSAESVKPYIKNLKNYPLPLDMAYPTYSWDLLYKDNQFVGIMREDRPLQAGEIIRHENSDFNTIMKVKALVEDYSVNRRHTNVIYHLDSENLSKFSDDEIKAIYR